MKPARIAGITIGGLLLVVALVLLVGGIALAALASERDSDGYLEADLARLESSTYALTSQELDLGTELEFPSWLRNRVTLRFATTADDPVFLGIGPAGDVQRYLQDVAREEVVEVTGTGVVTITHDGAAQPEEPGLQGFWVASSTGSGRQELAWELQPGQWTLVVMNPDASPGVVVDVSVGARLAFLQPLSTALLVAAGITLLLGVGSIWLSVRGRGSTAAPLVPPSSGGAPPPPPPAGPGPDLAPYPDLPPPPDSWSPAEDEQQRAPWPASTSGGSLPPPPSGAGDGRQPPPPPAPPPPPPPPAGPGRSGWPSPS